MAENLWPDFEVAPAIRSPKAVIDEVGRGLREKTGNLVTFNKFNLAIKDNIVHLTYSLYAPMLSYHFPFLRAKFGVEPAYPVYLTAEKIPEILASNEKELIAALATIFSAPSTAETIQRLMSLSV